MKIQVKKRLNHATFGCEQDYFERNIKGKKLKVLGEFNTPDGIAYRVFSTSCPQQEIFTVYQQDVNLNSDD